MSGLIVDTSVWIEFLKGDSSPELESALQDGGVFLSPLVLAELLSGSLSQKEEADLIDFLKELPLCPTPEAHWREVGKLRRFLLKKGLSVSIPDAHIAQCALDGKGTLYSFDKIFKAIAKQTSLKLL